MKGPKRWLLAVDCNALPAVNLQEFIPLRNKPEASDVLFPVLVPTFPGMHARSAVGTIALPFNVATEIEAILEIDAPG